MGVRKIRRSIKLLLKKRLAIILFCLSGTLLIAAAVTGYIIYHQGAMADENAQRLLEEYKQSLPSPTTTSTPIPKTYEGYEVLGILSIGKLDLELPVISVTSRETLKVSCCYYQGSMPGEDGNMVITGHDYADGSIFGRLSQLEIGDAIILYSPGGTCTYYVYDIIVIRPDDTAALNKYEGDMALTLMTCTNHGNRRLLVRCRELIE